MVTVRAGERLVRHASGLTQQELMIRGRINATPSLEELQPNAHWSAALDLGQSMYSPPPGQYRLMAELHLPDGARVRSNEVELEVTGEAVLAAHAQRSNPVLDGLNLVAKEAPIANRRDGVLVLSRGAGAFDELEPWVIGIDPLDVDSQAAALEAALDLPRAERRARLDAIRAHVRAHDLAAWATRELAELERRAPRREAGATMRS